MDLIRWVFLESIAALSVVIGVTLFFLLVYWRRTLKVRPLLAGLGVAIALLIVQSAVETPRETAEAVLDPIIADLSKDRAQALAAALASDFRADEMGPEAFVAWVARQLERVEIITSRSSRFAIENKGNDRFAAVASYSSNVAVKGEGTSYVPSTWEFEFVRINGRWKIARIQPVEIWNLKMRDWKQVESLR